MNRGRPSKCPYCDSTSTRPKGYRKTTTLGLRKLRICRNCKRRFTMPGKPRAPVQSPDEHLDGNLDNPRQPALEHTGNGDEAVPDTDIQ